MDIMIITTAITGASTSTCFLIACGHDFREQVNIGVKKLEIVGHVIVVALELMCFGQGNWGYEEIRCVCASASSALQMKP